MNVDFSDSSGAPLLIFSLFVLGCLICGLPIILRLRGAFFQGERILLALILGLTIVTYANLIVAMLAGLHGGIIIAVLVILIAIAVFSLKTRLSGLFSRRQNEQKCPQLFQKQISKTDLFGLAVFVCSFFLFAMLTDRLVVWENGALATGYLDNWGDLPYHVSLIMSFLNGGPLPPQNPSLAGEPLTYPFLSDFFSAVLMRIDIPLERAIELPAALLNSVTLTLLFYLGFRLVRNRAAAALALVLFLFAGGLGFLWFISDLYFAPKSIWEFLQHLPQRYTNISELKIHWVNPTLAHLLPQRSFLFGFPLALSIVLLWWNQKEKQHRQVWITGLFAGMLPLAHTHTFLTLMMVSGMMALLSLRKRQDRKNRLRYWLIFYAVTFLIALPQLIHLLDSRLSIVEIIRFELGWMAGSENLLWFWLKNTSLLLPLLVAALVFAKRLGIRRRALSFYLPFGMLLVICNLFLFSPFAYDTNKIMIYGFLLAFPFVARLLVALFASKSWWLHGLTFRLLFIALIFSGALNLVKALQSENWQELSSEEVDLARQIRDHTESQAIFLSAPVHNNLLTLAGRAALMGYSGHIFSHGFDHTAIEKEVRQIYSGDGQAEAYLRQYQVDYIVVGPHERNKYGASVDWLQDRFQVFKQSQNYVIYKVDPAIEAL